MNSRKKCSGNETSHCQLNASLLNDYIDREEQLKNCFSQTYSKQIDNKSVLIGMWSQMTPAPAASEQNKPQTER